MKQVCFTVLAILLLGFYSCKKGDDGAKGEQGERGIQGVKGEDGTMILSGYGNPSSSIGKIGDFYLDLSSTNFFGPKNANGSWPGAFNLKGTPGVPGATGTAGKDGSTILSGTTAPDTSIGKVGDFYFNTAQAEFYGPKTSAGWGLPVSLKGSTDGPKVIIIKNRQLVRYSSSAANYNDTWHPIQLSIQIDQKYWSYYDNGIVLASIRSGGDIGIWTTQGNEYAYVFGAENTTRRVYVNILQLFKSSMLIRGMNIGLTPSEFASVSRDLQVKLVFIPAASVEIMSANHIDITNPKAVSEFLKL